MRKISKYLLLVNLCIWILAGFYFALFRLPMTDDYYYAAEITEKGILGAIYNGAMNWDGRYMTLTALVQHFLIHYFGWSGARLFWFIAFIGANVCFALFFMRFFNIGRDKLLLLINVLFVGFWFSFKNHLAQTVFWAVGGVYVFNLFLFSLWLYLIFFVSSPFNYIMSLVIGMTTQNLVPIAFSILVFLFFLKKDRRILINLLLMLLGLLVISIMPGNFKRLEFNEVSLFSNFLKNYINVLRDYIFYSKYAFVVGLIAGFLFVSFVNNKNLNELKLLIITLFSGALLSIAPMAIITQKFALERTAIYFQVMVFFVFFLTILYLSSFVKYRKFYKLLPFVVMFYLNFYLLYNLLPQISDNARMFLEYRKRELFIKNEIKNGNYDLKVKQIKTSNWAKFYLLRIYDLEPYSNTWMNTAAAKYYNIKSLLTY